MSFTLWLTFAAACIVFSISPGAGAVASMSSSVANGTRKTLFTILGLQLSLFAHLLCVAAGLGAVLASSVWAFEALKYAGAAYLIWLGVKKWMEKPVLQSTEDHKATSSSFSLMKTGMMVNMSNPKSIIFLAAFLPQFIDPAAPALMQYVILGATTLLVDTLVMLGYMLMAGTTRKFLSSIKRIKIQNRVFGTLFMGAGLALATARRG